MTLFVAHVLAASGCDFVLQLDRPHGDDISTDDPTADLEEPVVRCAPGEIALLPLVADTYLDVDRSHGADPVLQLATADQAILLRVSVGDQIGAIASIHLDLRSTGKATECGAGCGSCTRAPGEVTLHWVRPDWDEATANRLERKPGVPWESVGATGASDRSPPILVLDLDSRDVATGVPFDRSMIPAGWPTAEIGIQLVATAGSVSGTFAGTFGSKESQSSTCHVQKLQPVVTAICR